ncbi:hypothetical protein Tco_1472231, partial [Tanacetum coccineum]
TASDETLYSSSSDESANETDDADESDKDLSNDNPYRDDDDASKENSLFYNISPTKLTSSQSKKADAKWENMRKINFKKAVAHKFKEYDEKQEALTNFNVSKAFEKVVQEKVLTEIKKLQPTHIPNAIANYAMPRVNTSVLEVMKTNQINLFTQSSTSIDDLS